MTSTRSTQSEYDLPDILAPQLRALLEHWQGLRRGDNEIPFSDDVNPSQLPGGGPRRALLLSVFENPLRFRLDHVGDDISARVGSIVTGKFTDEIALHTPLDDLTAQAAAVVEARAPRYFCHRSGYCRILLPTWNDGRIAMLLGAVDWVS